MKLIEILKDYVKQYPSVSVWASHKLFHFVMCFVFGFLISFGKDKWVAFILPIAIGILKERSDMKQGENLSTAILDVIVDALGAAGGILFFSTITGG